MPSDRVPVLTTSKAAEYLTERGLAVSDETLRRWAERERVRHLRLPSGHIRFRVADLEELLAPIDPRPAA